MYVSLSNVNLKDPSAFPETIWLEFYLAGQNTTSLEQNSMF